MANEHIRPDQHRPHAEEGVRENAEGSPRDAEQEASVSEEHRMSAEAARNEAEQFRRLAEEAREVRDRHREALEMIRQEGERTREAGEHARVAAEEARAAADAARHAAMEAVRATTDALQATVQQMEVVEEMRRTLRARQDGGKLGSNATYYDAVVACIGAVDAVLIFGPGEAKVELRQRLEKGTRRGRIVAIETIDKMTDRQIAARVWQHFSQGAEPGGRGGKTPRLVRR